MRSFVHHVVAIPVPLGVVGGAWAVQQLTVLPSGWAQVALTALGLLAGCAALVLRRVELRQCVALIAATLLAIAWASWRADLALAERIGPELEGIDLRVSGHVVGLATSSPTGRRFHFIVESCPDPVPACPLGRLALSWSQGFVMPSPFGNGAQGRSPGEREQAQVKTQTQTRPSRPASKPPVLRAGDRWSLTVRLKRPRATDNPGTFDAELRMLQDGVVATGYVRPAGPVDRSVRLPGQRWSIGIAFDRSRHRIRDALFDALGSRSSDAAAVLVALAIGDQQAVANRWWEIFNRTGVGHLMSISGLHITMLAALAMSIARIALRLPIGLNRRLLLRMPAPYLRWGVGVAVAFLYSGLAGWGIPAQRTCWMLAVTALAVLSGRSRGIAGALSLAAAVVTVLDPWAPMAAGFWLSFVAVAAIATHGSAVTARSRGARHGGLPADNGRTGASTPSLAGSMTPTVLSGPLWLERLTERCRLVLLESVASQWAATLSLLPLGALFFSSFSLVSPVANAFAIPLVSGLITPLVLLEALLATIWPALAAALSPLLVVPTAWLLAALEWLSRWPHATWTLARPDLVSLVLAGVAVAVLLRPHPVPMRAAWAFALLPLIIGGERAPDGEGLRVHALDVGQGMAILVETREFRLLYDTGPFWSAESNAGQRIVGPWLRARGVRHIDMLVISHPDLDHAGGAADIVRSFEVGTVLSSIPAGHPFRIDHPDQRSCRRGMLWERGAAVFEVLHPGDEMPPGAARSPTNARSCVLRIRTPSGSILLTGDLEARQELDLVRLLGRQGLAADILTMPHHGSNTSSTAGFIDAVSPRWALAQSGYRNRFGHPTAKVLGRYERAGVEVLRTDQLGAVTIELSPDEPPRLVRSRVDAPPYWRLR